MPSSGTVTFSLNRDQLITASLQANGYLGDGEVASSSDITIVGNILNMLVKNWSGSSDYAPGFKMWSRKRGNLILDPTKSSYNLGPSGDKWTEDVTINITTSNTSLSSNVIRILNPSESISANDNIGIVLDNGTIYWDTCTAVLSTSITIYSGIPYNSSSGSTVYSYTSQARRPISILTAVLRDGNSQDIPLDPMTVQDYESLPAKMDSTTVGDPQEYYYESQLTNGVLYLDIYPQDMTKYIHMVYLSPIEDFNASTDTIDMPQHWYMPLMYGLALHSSPSMRVPASKEVTDLFAGSLDIARNVDPEQYTRFFEPGRE